ncbi:MAG TPA: L-aspartate oxidase [Xanthobacteraceae bacterium]|nr:L-aspartate oxidase [Xanthobacteraceae bacterium]
MRMDSVIVIGGGVAGLATALRLAPLPVTLIAKADLGLQAATMWAQGGLAAALGPDDSPALHAQDTLKAGAGLSDEGATARITAAAPACIAWLERLGTPFDRNSDGSLALGLEAAHSRRRIAHAGGDASGRAVLETLAAAVRAAPSITLREGLRAEALLRSVAGTVIGVACVSPTGERVDLTGRAVVLATGGLGGLYASTTNPLGAVGSGLGLAARAGAVLRDMEFVQFHPTAIVCGADPMPLATEALRGDGATLWNDRGERFMLGVEGQELAPRDVVARAIFAEISAGRRVVLDARLEGLERRFPQLVALCRASGIDPVREPVPVRPAAHYHMGGVKVDALGRTSLEGLWACGEVASTGLHGANRLASNSLVEALACAGWIADDIAGRPLGPPRDYEPAFVPGPSANRVEIRRLMDAHVGVSREAGGLTAAVRRLDALVREGDDLALVALLVAAAALKREESRGGHFRTDFPLPRTPARHADTTLGETLALTAGLREAPAARRVA